MATRRKGPARLACDLCYKKKIKCDLGKPSCGNCVAYSASCTHGATAHQLVGSSVLAARVSPPRDIELLDQVEAIGQDVPSAVCLNPEPDHLLQSQGPERLPDLPPWSTIESTFEEYLNGCNRIVPTQDPTELRSAFANWYARPDDRDAFTWTQLNVVLAIAHRSGSPGSIGTPLEVSSYINNAQSVLSDLLAGEVDLSTIRVLVGMVLLFQTMPDLRPATLLIASALRLAHELELHTRTSHGPDPILNAQRDRVFWAAYLLDKEISLRVRQPSVQLDVDIDLDLPSLEPWDGAGFIFTLDGQHSYHYFREQVRLSRIVGALYDGLWSVRARKLSEDQRAQNRATVQSALIEWEQSVPWFFKPGNYPRTVSADVHGHFVKLYYEQAACLAYINGVDGLNLDKMRRFLGEVLQHDDTVLSSIPWTYLAELFRQRLEDFVVIPMRNTGLIWTALRPHLTGILCLVGNVLQNPQHPLALNDLDTCDSSLGFVAEDVVSISTHSVKNLREIRDLHSQLLKLAHARVWDTALGNSHHQQGGQDLI